MVAAVGFNNRVTHQIHAGAPGLGPRRPRRPGAPGAAGARLLARAAGRGPPARPRDPGECRAAQGPAAGQPRVVGPASRCGTRCAAPSTPASPIRTARYGTRGGGGHRPRRAAAGRRGAGSDRRLPRRRRRFRCHDVRRRDHDRHHRTVDRWDGDEAARRIEHHVGRDLQFIRINGTLVDELAGLLIHLASKAALMVSVPLVLRPPPYLRRRCPKRPRRRRSGGREVDRLPCPRAAALRRRRAGPRRAAADAEPAAAPGPQRRAPSGRWRAAARRTHGATRTHTALAVAAGAAGGLAGPTAERPGAPGRRHPTRPTGRPRRGRRRPAARRRRRARLTARRRAPEDRWVSSPEDRRGQLGPRVRKAQALLLRVLEAEEPLRGVVGVLAEVDVGVVGRATDPVVTHSVQQREVATLVHQVQPPVELVDVVAADEVTDLCDVTLPTAVPTKSTTSLSGSM